MLKLSTECMRYITRGRPEKTVYMKILAITTSRIARIRRLRCSAIAPSGQPAGKVSGCYNFVYRKYLKADEKKREKLKTMVMSPLSLSFGLTRPLCCMSLGSPCQQAVAEFRVVAEQISTRDLVQEYLANKVSPTLSEWIMPKLKGTRKRNELVRFPYRFKFEKQFKEPCQEWLEMIETMCNKVLGNYTKKEDQLMTATFGTRPKRRLNRVMDALNFEYPDYERLNKGAEG
jgi:hypothetical protein